MPPQATRRVLIHEFCRFDSEVGCERVPTLAAAMRAHGVGADVMEDADEVRGRIRPLSLLARFPSRCQPPCPGFLRRVVTPFHRQSQRRRVRDLLEHSRHRGQRAPLAGHGRIRWTAVACGRRSTLRVRLFVHRAPRGTPGARSRRRLPRDRLDPLKHEIAAKPAVRMQISGREHRGDDSAPAEGWHRRERLQAPTATGRTDGS